MRRPWWSDARRLGAWRATTSCWCLLLASGALVPSTRAQAQTPTVAAPSATRTPSPWRTLVRRVALAVDQLRDSTAIENAVSAMLREPTTGADSAQSVARTTLAHATVARLRYRYEASDSLHDWLVTHAEPGARLQARLGQVVSLGVRSRVADASRLVEGVIAEARAQADTITLADALLAATTLRARTRGAAALAATMDTLGAVLPAVRDDSAAHAAFACAQLRQLSPNDSAAVLRALREAVALADRRAAARVSAQCFLTAGTTQLSTYRMQTANDWLDSAHARAAAVGDRATAASVGQWQGFGHISLGGLLEARDALAGALRDAEASGAMGVLAWATLNSAQVMDGLGDQGRARATFARAARFMRAAEDDNGAAIVRGFELSLAIREGRTEGVRALLDAQLRAAEQSGNAQFQTATWELDTYARVQAGDAVGALRSDSMGADVERRFGPNARPMTVKRHALVLLALQRAPEAVPLLREVVAAFGPSQPRFRFMVRMQLALALAKSGDAPAAAREALDATAEFDRFRSTLSLGALRAMAFQLNSIFFGTDVTAPRLVAELARAGRAEDALRLAESMRARAVVDVLRGTDAAAGAASLASSVGAARAQVAPGTLPPLVARAATLHFTVAKDSLIPTTVLLQTAQGVRSVAAPALAALLPRVERWMALLQGNQPDAPLAQQLGDALLSALVRAIPPDVQTLVIVPDGALNQIPFAALIVDGRRVGDRFRVVVAPSATVLALMQQRPGVARAPRALLLADPASAATMVDGQPFPRLPGAEREVRAVAALMPGADVRIGAQANKRALLDAPMGDYTMAHFALHSLIDDRSVDGSMLILAGSVTDEGLLSASELQRSTLAPDLVVLSACRSMGGLTLEGEGVRGLPTTFLGMGARAVLATLWDVRDGEAEQVVVPFYRALLRGTPVAGALQAAQRAARAKGVSSQTWAAFVLVGDADYRIATNARGTR
jgi:CHAT domain-containing protein